MQPSLTLRPPQARCVVLSSFPAPPQDMTKISSPKPSVASRCPMLTAPLPPPINRGNNCTQIQPCQREMRGLKSLR